MTWYVNTTDCQHNDTGPRRSCGGGNFLKAPAFIIVEANARDDKHQTLVGENGARPEKKAKPHY